MNLQEENDKLKAVLGSILDRISDNVDYSTDLGPNLEMQIWNDISHGLGYNPIKETYDEFFARVGLIKGE